MRRPTAFIISYMPMAAMNSFGFRTPTLLLCLVATGDAAADF